MRVVFMGSPAFAVPTLKTLSEQYSVVALICQPDRPAGRGRASRPPATKVFAVEAGIPVLQPHRLRDAEVISRIAGLQPDLVVVAAYGQILPQSLLDQSENGSLNVHASLLPRWRGAAPIQSAILSGDKQSGVTIMQMDAGLDTGPILSQRKVRIEQDETGGALTMRLSHLGAELLIESLPGYLSRELTPVPQDETLSTYAPLLKKTDGALDLQETAEHLARQIRAFDPWPGTYIQWDDRRLAVKRAHTVPHNHTIAGEIALVNRTPAIGTRQGLLVLDRVQPSGKREMSGEAFIRGAPKFVGAQLLT